MAQRRCLTVGQSSGLDEKKQSTCASSEKHETHLPGESMRPLDLLVRLTHPSINQESPKCKTREKVIDFFGRAGGASARLQTVIDRIQGCKLRHLEVAFPPSASLIFLFSVGLCQGSRCAHGQGNGILSLQKLLYVYSPCFRTATSRSVSVRASLKKLIFSTPSTARTF